MTGLSFSRTRPEIKTFSVSICDLKMYHLANEVDGKSWRLSRTNNKSFVDVLSTTNIDATQDIAFPISITLVITLHVGKRISQRKIKSKLDYASPYPNETFYNEKQIK